MPVDDAWDWPTLLYVGTVLLRRSERAFWRMTPRKLSSLTKVHIRFNGGDDDKAGASKGFIDDVL